MATTFRRPSCSSAATSFSSFSGPPSVSLSRSGSWKSPSIDNFNNNSNNSSSLHLLQQQTSNSLSAKRLSAISSRKMASVNEESGINDELSKLQHKLALLKEEISSLSKTNFFLEKDIRYMDSRIALLIQDKIAMEEKNEMARRISFSTSMPEGNFPDNFTLDKYSNLFYTLQNDPKYIADLCQLVNIKQRDSLLEIVMFTIYGNQYDLREEYLLLTVFQLVLTRQFEESVDSSSLLRANTPLSKMIATYTRRSPGTSYLKTVMLSHLENILNNKNLNLEIDPLKIQREVYPDGDLLQSDPSKDDKITTIRKQRTDSLLQIVDSFFQSIIKNVDLVPFGIRWLCKQIRVLTKRNYPSAPDDLLCSLISAFFFLRFVNPAIVTPESYALTHAKPDVQQRRTLLLVAKSIQNLVNQTKTAKEDYMDPLSPFIEKNTSSLVSFLHELCDVPDFYEELETEKYVALSNNNLTLNITLNELYSTHDILHQYKNALTHYDASSKFKILLDDLGLPPQQVLTSEDYSISLPLFSRWDSFIEDIRKSSEFNQDDILFMEAKTNIVLIIRSIQPGSYILSRPLQLEKIAKYSVTVDDGILSSRGEKFLNIFKELVSRGTIDSNDSNNLLNSEVEKELAMLGSLKERVENEINLLQTALVSITEHNSYLLSQIDAYKSYLENVRTQSGYGQYSRTQGGSVIPHQLRFIKNSSVSVKKYSYDILLRNGAILSCELPNDITSHLSFAISSSSPGVFNIKLTHKDKINPLSVIDLQLDDLLEMQRKDSIINLGPVSLKTSKFLEFLRTHFMR